MEFKIVIDPDLKEEIVIYAREKTRLVKEIEKLIYKEREELTGYSENEIVKINPNEVVCFTIEKNKLYAVMDKERLHLKQRLYQIENNLDENFIKINQSTIANIKMIERFSASFGGSLQVIFKNGHKDYVSRRQLKSVKERMGI